MIHYSALAESSALLLTIYFITSGIFLGDDQHKIRLTTYRDYFILNFILFGLTIIIAIAGLWYSFIIFIISVVFLGLSMFKLFKLLMIAIPE